MAAQPQPRQLWGPTTTRKHLSALAAQCTAFELPAGGVLVFNASYTFTLQEEVIFNQPCQYNTTNTQDPGATGNATIIGPQEPFYSSVTPQIYALATATVIAYILVIVIFAAPRNFFHGGSAGARFLSRGGVLGGSTRNPAVIGVGRRPWLQKVATVLVAVSLTIATADTFRVAEEQYQLGFIDSDRLVDRVVGSVEIRVIQLISDTFLWLAQVQTLIRLFPRHKEKVTIKWLGFALVLLDTIFSILDDFISHTVRTRPRSFQDAIPALNYLFELSISLIYMACVIYYSISKRRFAFWHPKMKNICLVAVLSLASVLIPVVFFVLDIANPDLAGWGDYIRWVGAAAASVVVWEWVERIEALERDERKDGILGREIFDGDDMLDDENSDDFDWNESRRNDSSSDVAVHQDGLPRGPRLPTLRFHMPQIRREKRTRNSGVSNQPPAVPEQTQTPVSRADTTSAASTVYAVRFLTNSRSPAIPEDTVDVIETVQPQLAGALDEKQQLEVGGPNAQVPIPIWKSVQNPFKRKRMQPPAEVIDAQEASGTLRAPTVDRPGLRSRVRALASTQLSARTKPEGVTDPLPVTIIPAQRRTQRVWTPEEVQEPSQQQPAIPTPIAAPTVRPRRGSTRASRDALLVTVIPAPKRGQGTWSPDDPRNAVSSVSGASSVLNKLRGNGVQPEGSQSHYLEEATQNLSTAQDQNDEPEHGHGHAVAELNTSTAHAVVVERHPGSSTISRVGAAATDNLLESDTARDHLRRPPRPGETSL